MNRTAPLPARAVVALAFLSLLALAPTASAHRASASGGAYAPQRPEVEEVQCGTEPTAECPEGELLRLKGEHLERSRKVVFLGGKGRADNRRVRVRDRSLHRVVVRIPTDAPSGRVRVRAGAAGKSRRGPRVEVLESQADSSAPSEGADTAFPVRGRYDYGTRTNRYGGGRGHEGQDVFSKCGNPIVAALAGEVTTAKWHDAAGNYVVIKAEDGTSQAYMHLRERAIVRRGDSVVAGQKIGRVGDTGRATGCHLHFEFWTAPGWYEGGDPVDPLPYLKRWAAAEGR